MNGSSNQEMCVIDMFGIVSFENTQYLLDKQTGLSMYRTYRVCL